MTRVRTKEQLSPHEEAGTGGGGRQSHLPGFPRSVASMFSQGIPRTSSSMQGKWSETKWPEEARREGHAHLGSIHLTKD